MSTHVDTLVAARQVLEAAEVGLEHRPADLAFLFYSPQHCDKIAACAEMIRDHVGARALLGVSAEGVIGGDTEIERAAGMSLLLCRMPGTGLRVFTGESMLPVAEPKPEIERAIASEMGITPETRASFLFADPFTVPVGGLLTTINNAVRRAMREAATVPANVDGDAPTSAGWRDPLPPILGGLASGGRTPGGNVLIANNHVTRSGLVGVTVSGPVRVDTLISQGCRPFGKPVVITKVRGNVILELAGRNAVSVVQEMIEELGEDERTKLQGGLFVGRVINEYKQRFGRDDFLIRGVLGIDRNLGAIAVADLLRAGQTVQLHYRDAQTASEDLSLLLDAQRLHEPPAGALLVTCNGRGSRMFDRPSHDAGGVAKAFRPVPGGESLSKGGTTIEPGSSTLPLAGFFAGGEIGPVGGSAFLHGHTACVALFRDA
ncbi:MAG: FIST N-terminal domain-containing protein [Planctomycetota bacterium]|nr:FIST N-terminal domain-containing protein [Planctomycetota bacterium]